MRQFRLEIGVSVLVALEMMQRFAMALLLQKRQAHLVVNARWTIR